MLASARECHSRAVMARTFDDSQGVARNLRELRNLLRNLQGIAADGADLCDTYLASRCEVTCDAR